MYGESFWRKVLDYIYRHFVEPYRNVYLKLDGKPLVLSFAPVGLVYRPKDPRFVIRVVATRVDLWKPLSLFGIRADWDLWPDYIVGKPRVELKIRTDGYVAIAPRFDDTRMCIAGARRGCWSRLLDPDYSSRIYEEEWRWILSHLDKVKIIAIYSWNEYHERSEIEPHIDATARNGLYPYEITKTFIQRVKSLCREVDA